MKNMQYKFSVVRSIFALILMSAIVLGSVFTVAAAMQSGENGNINGSVVKENGTQIRRSAESIAADVFKIKKVTVDYEGEIVAVYISDGTVSDALDRAGIKLSKAQSVFPDLSFEITADMNVMIYKGKKIAITADGETKEVYVPQGNTIDVLNKLGYRISQDDILNVSADDDIWNTDKITIKRVNFGEETVVQTVKYKSINEAFDKLEPGETQLKNNGVNGKKLVTKKCKYIDGKKVSEKFLESKITIKPIDKITLVGTKGTSTNGGAGTFTDMYGNKIAYKSVHTGSGTAYTAPSGACTATGVAAYHGGVAVNPNIIPYGSKLYIASTDGSVVYGYATAVDTGGALMDGSAIVDCFYNTYDECISFGRRDVNVYVLA